MVENIMLAYALVAAVSSVFMASAADALVLILSAAVVFAIDVFWVGIRR